MDFRSGGWLIGGRPTSLLILGDHLFLNYKKNGQWWLINRAGIINPHLTLTTDPKHLTLNTFLLTTSRYILGNIYYLG